MADHLSTMFSRLRVLFEGTQTGSLPEQLASVPEEGTIGFTDPLPPPSTFWESGTWSRSEASLSSPDGASPLSPVRTTPTTQTGSLPEQLASVPEEGTTGFTDPLPPPSSYRASIRSVVVWLGWGISSQSGQNYCSNSGASGSSYPSNYSSNSGASGSNYSVASSGSAFAAEAGLSASDRQLAKIAQRMVSDGYLLRIFQSFIDSSSSPTVPCAYGGRYSLENWFVELDVDWVLQMRDNNGEQWRFQFRDMLASRLQELVERWTRAMTIIVVSFRELFAAIHDEPAVAQFGKASISPMLVFIDAIIQVNEVHKLQALLRTYVCVSNASYNMSLMHVNISSEAQSIFNEMGASLDKERKRLIGAISNTMLQMGYLDLHYYYPWDIAIPRGAGEVHGSILFLMNCIALMRKAMASLKSSAQSHYAGELDDLIHDKANYLKDLLLKKSALCSDPSIRYMFLLNNSHLIAQVSDPSMSLDVEVGSGGHRQGLKLTPECEKYMDSYLDASWGHVLSCIPKSRPSGLIRRWLNTPSLAKFESAFLKTYKAQKFWKVTDPRLRDVLRRAITERIIPGYRDYLKEHPQLEKYSRDGSSSAEVLEKMLAELFEG